MTDPDIIEEAERVIREKEAALNEKCLTCQFKLDHICEYCPRYKKGAR